jgi:hypothetical protein
LIAVVSDAGNISNFTKLVPQFVAQFTHDDERILGDDRRELRFLIPQVLNGVVTPQVNFIPPASPFYFLTTSGEQNSDRQN